MPVSHFVVRLHETRAALLPGPRRGSVSSARRSRRLSRTVASSDQDRMRASSFVTARGAESLSLYFSGRDRFAIWLRRRTHDRQERIPRRSRTVNRRASRPCGRRSRPADTPARTGCASNYPNRCSGRSSRPAAFDNSCCAASSRPPGCARPWRAAALASRLWGAVLPRLFISHSNKDSLNALAFQRWLELRTS
jgi:hypothetical protein